MNVKKQKIYTMTTLSSQSEPAPSFLMWKFMKSEAYAVEIHIKD